MFVTVAVGRHARPGTRVVADSGTRNFIRVPDGATARVGAGFGIVRSRATITAERTIDAAGAAVHAGIRVVPARRTERIRIGIVIGITGVVAPVGRVVPAGAVHHAEADTDAGVAAVVAGRHRVVVALFHDHVCYVIRVRRRRDRVDLRRNVIGDDPGAVGGRRHVPHGAVTEVIGIADEQDVVRTVHRSLHAGAGHIFEDRLTFVEDGNIVAGVTINRRLSRHRGFEHGQFRVFRPRHGGQYVRLLVIIRNGREHLRQVLDLLPGTAQQCRREPAARDKIVVAMLVAEDVALRVLDVLQPGRADSSVLRRPIGHDQFTRSLGDEHDRFVLVGLFWRHGRIRVFPIAVARQLVEVARQRIVPAPLAGKFIVA